MTGQLLFPKGESRDRAKRREQRAERVIIADVRGKTVDRDGYCRLYYLNDATRAIVSALFGACRGPSEWAHFGEHKRSKTRGHAPSARHTVEGSLMLCRFHHHEYDQHRLHIEALHVMGSEKAAILCNGPLRFERDGKLWEESE